MCIDCFEHVECSSFPINEDISYLTYSSATVKQRKPSWSGRFVWKLAYVCENSYSCLLDVDGEIVIRLACRRTIKLLVGTLCTAGCFIAWRILVPSVHSIVSPHFQSYRKFAFKAFNFQIAKSTIINWRGCSKQATLMSKLYLFGKKEYDFYI